VFVIDGDKLLEIDLRTRGVRTVFEAPGLESVAIFYEPTPTPRTNQAELADAAEADAAGAAVAPAEAVIADGPLIPHIILRAGDRLVILNPATAVQREYQLPAELLEKYLSLYSLPDGTFLANSAERNSDGGTSLDLLWLAPDFRITRQETVQLAAMPQFSMRQMAWMVGAVVPAPIIWFAFIGIAMPHEPSLVAAQFSYSGAIAHVIGQVWPTALAVAAAGALMVWFTYRQQRTYHRPLTAAWCAFVLLFGLPGLIAYLIEYRRTKLESCSECNAIVPRDREACADCETPFATPRLTGTEIFA
jgi:hypothetical protein